MEQSTLRVEPITEKQVSRGIPIAISLLIPNPALIRVDSDFDIAVDPTPVLNSDLDTTPRSDSGITLDSNFGFILNLDFGSGFCVDLPRSRL
ncbi:hypothetical protein EVAR_31753_1 [Eumeta japonica]|uniref:Uncharacterized protein n=1 Tax=Eumeta variegata TaxID=151549 RepID=A0A4C1W3F4_EUMVA|nr:hypothetical protein EVAR_31753_1 [Eumeta japonica]